MDPSNTTLAGYLPAYAAGRLTFCAATALQYAIAVHSLDLHVGHPVLLSELSAPLVVGWLRSLLAIGRSASTVKSKRQAVVTCWRAAAEEGIAPPVPKIPKPQVPDKLPIVWTVEEVNRIWRMVDGLPGYWGDVPIWLAWRIGLGCVWDSGCRLSEMLRARCEHVWADKGWWFVPSCNRKGQTRDRLYKLSPDTLGWIRQSLPSEREVLFPFPWQPRQVWDHYRRILQAAGLPCDRTRMFHCVRRTVESLAAAEKGTAWAAACIGHTEAVARRHYISPMVAPGPSLVDVLPRPSSPQPRLRVI